MDETEGTGGLRWFGVRCIFRHGDSMYEERITLWRARDLDDAIRLAEAEAAEYATAIDAPVLPTTYVELAQAYELADDPRTDGAEVFSLIRDSDLAPRDYLHRFFSTGAEHEGSD